MHVLRAVVRRARSPELLVQLAVRGVPDLRRARDPARGRRRARRPRSRPHDQRGGDRAVGQQHARVLVPRAGGGGRGARLLARHAVEEAPEGRARRGALRLGRRGVRPVQEPVQPTARVPHHLRRGAPEPRATARRDGLGRGAREARAVHARDPVPDVQRLSPPRREPGGHGRRPQHLAADREGHPRHARVHRRHGALRAGAHDRGAPAEGDPRAPGVPDGRRSRLPEPRTRRRERSPAARRSGSGWPRRSAAGSSASSTSWTSPRSACTSATTDG